MQTFQMAVWRRLLSSAPLVPIGKSKYGLMTHTRVRSTLKNPQVALDEQCRRLGIGFVSIHTAGLYANVFFDFGKFEFTNEYVK